MKATIIVSIVLCLLIGGIAGWALKGAVSGSTSATMLNITDAERDSTASSRIAIYDGGTLIVADYNPMYNGGTIEHLAKRKVK